jgi:cytochrome c biogenesis protein ResB
MASTFLPQELADRLFYGAGWFGGLWLIFGVILIVGLLGCLRRKRFNLATIHLGIILIILAGFLNVLFAQNGFIEIEEGQSADGFWIEDDLFRPFDFLVTLKDFSLEYYPRQWKGMHFVKSFKSELAIIDKDGNLLKEGAIQVNRPLKFNGFLFYQYGHDARFPKRTLLQVVKDPGLGVAYSGYLILLLGLACSFREIWKI